MCPINILQAIGVAIRIGASKTYKLSVKIFNIQDKAKHTDTHTCILPLQFTILLLLYHLSDHPNYCKKVINYRFFYTKTIAFCVFLFQCTHLICVTKMSFVCFVFRIFVATNVWVCARVLTNRKSKYIQGFVLLQRFRCKVLFRRWFGLVWLLYKLKE